VRPSYTERISRYAAAHLTPPPLYIRHTYINEYHMNISVHTTAIFIDREFVTCSFKICIKKFANFTKLLKFVKNHFFKLVK